MTPREGNEGNPSVAPASGRDRAPSVMGARLFAILLAVLFLGFGAQQVLAQEGLIYSPCWTKDECLNLNATGASSVTQAGMGECANGRCFCSSSSCYDPHRLEASCPPSQGKCYANPPPVPLTIAIGGAVSTLDVGDYIAKVYDYGVTIAGILAGVMFVVGGFQYLTAGNSGRVTKAKERIRDAIIGLLLVLGAYVILNTINPDVLRLQMPKISLVKKKLFVACQYFDMQKPCGQPFTLVRVQGVPDSASYSEQYRLSTGASDSGTATTQCIGKSCSLAGSNDASFRCRIPPNAPATSTNTPAPAADASAQSCLSQPVAPYQCLPCKQQNETCRGSGPNSECCGGYCAGGAIRSSLGGLGSLAGSAGVTGPAGVLEGHCTNGANGSQCGVDAECFSHHCADTGGTGLGGQCVSGDVGSLCDANSDCNSGFTCIQVTGIHVCGVPQPYGPCDSGSDCPSGSSCGDDKRCDPHITGCNTDADCTPFNDRLGVTLHCWTDHDPHVCKTNGPGSVCHSDADCSDIPGGKGYCYDGAIQNSSGIAGICVQSGPGSGCDPGGTGDGQCQRSNPPAVCRAIQSNWGNDGLCTLAGTAGTPCVGPSNNGGPNAVTNTCRPPLTCPQGVYICVNPPGCPSH